MSRGNSLSATADVEYSDDPTSVLTEEEKEELCNFFDCRVHAFGTKSCPIEKAEKKVLKKL